MYPNSPRPAPGTYKCRGCEKGSYSVSSAQAHEVDMHGRRVFYVPGCSPPLNPRSQTSNLDQKLLASSRVDAAEVRLQAITTKIATKITHPPTHHHQCLDPFVRYPHAGESRFHPTSRHQPSGHMKPPPASMNGSKLGSHYGQESVDNHLYQRSKPRQYRVVNE